MCFFGYNFQRGVGGSNISSLLNMRRPHDYPTILHLRAQVKDRAELMNTTSDQPINTLRSTSPIVPVREGREGGREGEVASKKGFYI